MSDEARATTKDEWVTAFPRIVLLARCFFVFLGSLPWWLPLLQSRVSLGLLGAILDHFFVAMCHRISERSLMLQGVIMPVCSRCAGVYAGFAIAALVARPRWPMKIWRPLLFALCGLMLLDIVTQDLGLHPVWHPVRLITGFALGYGMVVVFVTHLGVSNSERMSHNQRLG